MIPSSPILQIEGLVLEAQVRRKITTPVSDAHLTVNAGEVVGLVGESGSGKTLTALTVPRLLPHNVRVVAGMVQVNGVNMSTLSEEEITHMRGSSIGMVFQDSLASLNPTQRIGTQIAEVVKLHDHLTTTEVRQRTLDLMSEVGLPRPHERIDAYPHQLSGGMRQRVAIAMAIGCNPKLIIADEPTTALDVTVQAQILGLLRQLADKRKIGILLITHDLGVVAQIADRATVMYGGRTVEECDVYQAFESPRHPYTQALVASAPKLHGNQTSTGGIAGTPPDPSHPETGCPFAPRCAHAQSDCLVAAPSLDEYAGHHKIACFHPQNPVGASDE
jgi:oligopeptide/dipeptide ABC transporter ATP-binding protein